MSVLKRKRNISKIGFYHNAIKLRLMIMDKLFDDLFKNNSQNSH